MVSSAIAARKFRAPPMDIANTVDEIATTMPHPDAASAITLADPYAGDRDGPLVGSCHNTGTPSPITMLGTLGLALGLGSVMLAAQRLQVRSVEHRSVEGERTNVVDFGRGFGTRRAVRFFAQDAGTQRAPT